MMDSDIYQSVIESAKDILNWQHGQDINNKSLRVLLENFNQIDSEGKTDDFFEQVTQPQVENRQEQKNPGVSDLKRISATVLFLDIQEYRKEKETALSHQNDQILNKIQDNLAIHHGLSALLLHKPELQQLSLEQDIEERAGGLTRGNNISPDIFKARVYGGVTPELPWSPSIQYERHKYTDLAEEVIERSDLDRTRFANQRRKEKIAKQVNSLGIDIIGRGRERE